jgi:ubiquinone biosynthesis protein Coq4
MIDPMLLEAWHRSVENPEGDSVSEAHKLFYSLSAETTKQEYYSAYLNNPALKRYVEDPYFPPDYEFASLGALPEGSLGYAYYRHIVDHGLKNIEMKDFESYKAALEVSAPGMPEALKYATFRSYQTHDLMHILAGYGIDHYGELAVQAFGLAQFKRPYPILLMSVATAHAAFLRPDRIEEYMDAIADGWTKGKRAKLLIGVRWEEFFNRSLLEIQREYNLI